MNDDTFPRASLIENALPDECHQDLQRCLSVANIRTENVELRHRANGSDALLDVEWTEQTTEGFSTTRRTLAFFYRRDARLPPLTIQPKKGIISKFLLKAMRAAGVPEVPFPERTDFAELYSVQSFTQESARALLVPSVLDALIRIEGLCVRTEGNSVIAWIPRSAVGGLAAKGLGRDERLNDADRDQLIRDAWHVCHFIVENSEAGLHAAEAVKGSYAEEGARTAQQHGGLVGRMISRSLVTSEMVDRVYKQSPPRSRIDAPIVRRAYGGSTFPLLVLGFITLGFVAFASVFTFVGGDHSGTNIGPLFFIPPVITSIVVFFILRWRLGRRRLLWHGRMVQAQVSHVSSTGLTSGNDTVSKITFKLSGGITGSPSMNVKSQATRIAQGYLAQATFTRVLVNENEEDPKKCLWLDGWAIESQTD